MDGITLAEKLLEKNPSILIVFVTSWNQFAVQAFDMNAIDYIMKPSKKSVLTGWRKKFEEPFKLWRSRLRES